MVHNHIERLNSKISEMQVNSQAREARLKAREESLEEQQRINNSNALLIETLQTQQAMNVLLLQTAQVENLSMRQERQEARDALELARDAFELEVAYLRDNNDALGLESTAMKQERSARKKKESNAKRCVLRSFDWREDKVDASVLRGAVAFWGATTGLVEDGTEEQKRMSNKARQNILKVIVEQGFNGELHDDMEKAFVKKKRFKVFALSKKSDLESKFGGEAIGSCQNIGATG
jgi:hypothetical protein